MLLPGPMLLPAASVVCALVAALLFAGASVAQQSAASEVPEGSGLMSTLFRSPRWWAGVVGDGGGYVMQAVALAIGSVLVVQPLLVSALLFALPPVREVLRLPAEPHHVGARHRPRVRARGLPRRR